MKSFSYYLIFFVLLFIVALSVVVALWLVGSSESWVQLSLLNVVFLFLLTILSFGLFYVTFKEKNKSAPMLAVVLSFTGKLIFSGLLVLILQRIIILEPIPFFVSFAISYVWFTVPEIVSLVRIGDYLSRKEKNEVKGRNHT